MYPNIMPGNFPLYFSQSSTSFHPYLSLFLCASTNPFCLSLHPSTNPHPPSLFFSFPFLPDPPSAQRSIQLMGSEKPPHATLLIVTSCLPAGYNLFPIISIHPMWGLQSIMALHRTYLSLQQVSRTANLSILQVSQDSIICSWPQTMPACPSTAGRAVYLE